MKEELRKARRELLHVRVKNALRITTKATAIMLSFILPPIVLSYGLGKLAGKNSYFYEEVSVDSNGNEESLRLVDTKKDNLIRVFTSCNKTEDGYVITYDDYTKKDIDSTVFSYIHNKDDLSTMLGTPVDNGYVIDDKGINIDKDYAHVIEYRKSNVKNENAMDENATISGLAIGMCIDLVAARLALETNPFKKIDDVFGVDRYDVCQAKKKVKTLKKKKEEL